MPVASAPYRPPLPTEDLILADILFAACGRSARGSLSNARRISPMLVMRQCLGAVAAISLAACNLDLQNPNQPTTEQVTTSPEGVIALATGLQGRFAQSYGNYAYMAGLVTDEFASTPSARISISDAEKGAVPPG